MVFAAVVVVGTAVVFAAAFEALVVARLAIVVVGLAPVEAFVVVVFTLGLGLEGLMGDGTTAVSLPKRESKKLAIGDSVVVAGEADAVGAATIGFAESFPNNQSMFTPSMLPVSFTGAAVVAASGTVATITTGSGNSTTISSSFWTMEAADWGGLAAELPPNKPNKLPTEEIAC